MRVKRSKMHYDFKVKIPEVKGKIYERMIKGCSLFL